MRLGNVNEDSMLSPLHVHYLHMGIAGNYHHNNRASAVGNIAVFLESF